MGIPLIDQNRLDAMRELEELKKSRAASQVYLTGELR